MPLSHATLTCHPHTPPSHATLTCHPQPAPQRHTHARQSPMMSVSAHCCAPNSTDTAGFMRCLDGFMMTMATLQRWKARWKASVGDVGGQRRQQVDTGSGHPNLAPDPHQQHATEPEAGPNIHWCHLSPKRNGVGCNHLTPNRPQPPATAHLCSMGVLRWCWGKSSSSMSPCNSGAASCWSKPSAL